LPINLHDLGFYGAQLCQQRWGVTIFGDCICQALRFRL
jgi:hypothetical protein